MCRVCEEREPSATFTDQMSKYIEALHESYAALERENVAHGQTIRERDHFEEILTNLADAAGCTKEWSNLHEHSECIEGALNVKSKETRTEGVCSICKEPWKAGAVECGKCIMPDSKEKTTPPCGVYPPSSADGACTLPATHGDEPHSWQSKKKAIWREQGQPLSPPVYCARCGGAGHTIATCMESKGLVICSECGKEYEGSEEGRPCMPCFKKMYPRPGVK